MEAARQQLEKLILDAERLMATARAEAFELVSSAELQAKELVDAARQLHAVAENEAQTIQDEASTVRAHAERQAQQLLDEAQHKHHAAIEQARSITVLEPSRETPVVESDDDDAADAALHDASRRVDQMLRVARSEAKANADELMEQARRRAAQIDEDARRRQDVAAKQHRAALQAMRDEQLAIRTRIAELRSELRAAEMPTQPDQPIGSEVDTPDPVQPASAEPNAATARRDAVPMRPLVVPARTAQHQRLGQAQSTGEVDDDYAKAVKRFRRRA